jgi:long-chain acyl-CoA synthetase
MSHDAPSLAAMLQDALARPDSERAVQFGGRWLDWGWMRRVAERVNALIDEAGVKADEPVGLVAANRPDVAAALLGLMARDRHIVMIYAYQSPEALARRFAELKCAAIIAPAETWATPARQAAVEAGSLAIALSLDAQHAVEGTCLDRRVEHRRAAGAPGLAMLTSGTTGPPKTVQLDYALIRRSMVLESPVHPYGAPAPATPMLMSSPLGNVAGLYAWLPLAVAGRPIILLEKFSLDAWLAYVREERPVSVGLPAPAYRKVLDLDIPPEDLASIQYMSSGSSPLEVELQRAFEEKYGVVILPTYGATEFGGGIAVMTPDLRARFGEAKRGSVGQPLPGVEARVVDPATRELAPAGREGVLEVRTSRLGPDWVRTTDLAVIDEDGFLYIRGRTDGAINRGGFKINPEVVRTALLEHPAIADAVVTGVPDRRLGEVPAAAYQVWANAAAPSREALEAHLRSRLPATFLPTRYLQVGELPKTHTQKLDLGAIKAMFAEMSEAAEGPP